MKEPRLTSRFEQSVADLRDKEETKELLRHLGDMREAVRGLQADGLPLALQVRPGAYKCPVSVDSSNKIVANGTITLGGATEVDFLVARAGNNSSPAFRLSLYLGKNLLVYEYLSSDDRETAGKTLATTVLGVAAQVNLLDEFNIDETGRPGLVTGKVLSVSPPLKLKNPPKP